MSLTRTTCPGCGAGLKSAAGFNPGQSVRCPKCSTAFAVPEPAFEEVGDEPEPDPTPARKGPPARAARGDDDRPRRRRPRDDDDEDDDEDDDRPRKKGKKGGYKTSPLRFAVLGVLLVILGVLAFMLYQKKQKEKEDAAAPAPAAAGDDDGLGAAQPRFAPGPRGPELAPALPGGGGKAGGFGPPPGNGPAAAAAERAENNLKQIMLGLHTYHDRHNAFPPAAVVGPDGKALLSWRVTILPFIEEESLYKQFKLDEPWDGPANKKLIPLMPRTYQMSLPVVLSGRTAFKVFVGGGAAFDLKKGKRMSEFTDGLSNTLGVVESGPPVDWTQPADIPFDGKTAPQFSPLGANVTLAAMMDGSVRRLDLSANPPAVIIKAVTAAGGEAVDLK